jgi:ABC-type antimicrobial peptide transport system permease subunit
LSADAAFNSQARETQVRSSDKESVSADEQIVTDGFLAAMGMDFSTTDRPLSSVVLSQSLAKCLYGANSAVGRQVQIGTGSRTRTATVVGIAGDAVLRDPKERATAVVYDNWWDGPMFFPNLVVRTATADPTRLINDVRAVVEGEHREFVSRVRTLQGTFDTSLTHQFLLASLSAAFGSLGLLLAGVGLFGLLAFTVAQRRNEIGVRLTLGASRAHVIRTVVGDSLRTVFVGMALGTPLGWIASRAATTVIGGARVNIAASLVIGGALLTVAAFAATAPPAVRASAIDPLDALRQD